MDPREWRQSVEKRLNDLLDRAMSLITALDLMEADCDLEETADDEYNLGWPTGGPKGGMDNTDREQDDGESGYGDADGMVAEERGEPSLGWTVSMDQSITMVTDSTAWIEDGEQDAGDEPEIVHDGETVNWENDPESQEALVTL